MTPDRSSQRQRVRLFLRRPFPGDLYALKDGKRYKIFGVMTSALNATVSIYFALNINIRNSKLPQINNYYTVPI